MRSAEIGIVFPQCFCGFRDCLISAEDLIFACQSDNLGVAFPVYFCYLEDGRSDGFAGNLSFEPALGRECLRLHFQDILACLVTSDDLHPQGFNCRSDGLRFFFCPAFACCNTLPVNGVRYVAHVPCGSVTVLTSKMEMEQALHRVEILCRRTRVEIVRGVRGETTAMPNRALPGQEALQPGFSKPVG